MKKCVIYARVSTVEQETANQINQLNDYASKQGWEVVETIIDVGSGAKGRDQRAGLDKVFTLAHQKQFDLLLFWSLDRFSREGSRKTIGYLTQLESYGVGFHSFTEPYLSTLGIFSDSIVALLSALAKQERIRISERTKAGLERTRTNGTKLGRPRTCDAKLQQALKLREEEKLSFTEIGARLGVTRARAFQMVQVARDSNRF